MLLACLVLGIITCRDTIDLRAATSPAQLQRREAVGPVTMLRLICTFSFSKGEQGEVRCGKPGSELERVNRSAVLPASNEYAAWFPDSLVRDTVTETWSFLAVVQNRLAQHIGTLDGTTAVGTKVAVTYGPVASAGTGTVSLINADGTGTFTAPNQPYFDYPGIVAPGAYSTYRTWQVHVPNTVTEVTMGVAISTDFPAEQNVATTPPDTVPSWIYADSNIAAATQDYPSRFVKNVALVMFDPSATLSDRQLAIAKVGGEVIGGVNITSSDGMYVLRLNVPTTAELFARLDALRALPQVRTATPERIIDRGIDYLEARDDSSVSNWSLNPDKIGQEPNWALERIAAPMAWGCSVGSSSTTVGIVDMQFHANVPDLSPTFISNAITTAGRHGLAVASIVGADGSNGTGMTGVMWRSDLRLYARDFGTNGTPQPMSTATDILRIKQAARDGARVINLSGGAPPYPASEAAMKRAVFDVIGPMAAAIRDLAKEGHAPLLVLSAGNTAVDVPQFNANAFYNTYPVLADSFPGQVIVVGATNRFSNTAPTTAYRVESLRGNLVEIIAPGTDVLALDEQGAITHPFQRTSAAAPLVAGAAGLLFSFDPALTAADVKQFLIAGAVRGGRWAQDTVADHNTPLLNIYESLKLAAERPSAPLCGNRVWTADNAVYTERGSGSATQLFNIGEPAGFVNVLHGGRRVQVFGMDSFDYREFDYANGQWTDMGSAYDQPAGIWSGATNSLRRLNHDADSVVYVQIGGGAGYAQFTVMLRDTSAGSIPRALASWNVPTQIPTDMCVQEDADVYYPDTLPRLRKYDCVQVAPVGASTSASAAATFSPLGDRIITTVSVSTTNSSLGSWSSCPWTFTYHNSSIESSHCRSVAYQSSFSNAQVQSIRISDGQIQALPSIPTSNVFWQAVGEPGKEMVVEVADVQDSYKFEPVADSGWRTTSQQQSVIGCRVEFRDLSSGAVLRSIPLGNRCAAAGSDGIGTFSPMVSSRRVPVKASSSQP